MMKLLAIASVMATVGLASNVFAACGSPTVNPNLFVLNTACVGTSGNWEAQEYHSGGTVIEWARGSGHPTDPTHQVGTYSVSDTSITYNYTGGPSYTYTVHKDAADPRYYFCTNGALKATATLKSGQGACP